MDGRAHPFLLSNYRGDESFVISFIFLIFFRYKATLMWNMAYVILSLSYEVSYSFYHNGIALYVRLSDLAGTKDDVDGVPFGFRYIAFVEFLFVSDFYDLKAFLNHICRELPEFLEFAV